MPSSSESKGTEREASEPISSTASVGVAASREDISTLIASSTGGNVRSFSSLADVVSEKTLKAIKEMGFTDMMEIQHRSIRPLLEGRYMFVWSEGMVVQCTCTCNYSVYIFSVCHPSPSPHVSFNFLGNGVEFMH